MKDDDRQALDTLFRRYYVSLCQFALSLVRNSPDAEEIVSDVFFTLWKQRAARTVNTSVKAYLFSCVRHACLGRLRKEERRFYEVSTVENTLQVSETQPEETPDETVVVDKLLGVLPFRCRRVFVLARLEGLSYKEISELLNLSERTVENHVARALQILRNEARLQTFLAQQSITIP